MKIGKIDFNEIFEKFWKDPKRDKVALGWLGVTLVMVVPMFFFMFISILQDLSKRNEMSTMLGLVLCVFYILFISLSLVINFFTFGSSINQYKIYKNKKFELEMFENFGSKLSDGFRFFLVSFVYALPVILFMVTVIVLIIMAIISATSGDNASLGASLFILVICSYCFIIVLSIAYQMLWGFFAKPIVIKFIAEDRFGDCFNPSLIYSEIKSRQTDILNLALSLFVMYFIWGMVYMVAYFSVYILIGVILLPVVFVIYYLLRVYIEPYMINQALSDEVETKSKEK